ncbi:MAG: restriction endonuclease subunit S [Bacteroidia bacterium]|nr:restriction endonuclease subunit S [Bacteroidia bacterium]
MPKDWESLQFKDVVDGFSSGSTPSRENLDYFKGNILWITSGELNYNVITDTKEKISQEAVRNTNLSILNPGTFLIAITGLEAAGTRGSCGIVGKQATANQSCMALIPKENLDLNYLFHFYIQYGEMLAFEYCQGTKQQSYNSKLVKILPITLPPLPEQRAIARVLSTWDEGISKTQALITQKELRKKWLMQQLLTGKKRLKGFGGEWREVKFGTFLKESRITGNTGNLSKKITVKLYGKGVFAKDEKTIGSENTQYFIRKKGQLIYSKLDFLNGAFGIIPDELNNYESTLDLPCFDIEESKINKDFLLSFVAREDFYKKYDDGAIGGRKAKRIQVKEFLSIKPVIPSLTEQTAIAQVLQAADKEISLLKAKAEKLKEQKKGLMQVLLTGRVRMKG